jgi:hypothetical protein
MTKLKVAVAVSSLFASAALVAQSTAPSQASGASAPTAQPPVQIAQGSGAPGAVTSGAQATGAAVTEAGAAATAGAGFGIPGMIAVGLTAVGAATTNDNGEKVQATTNH